MKHLFKSTLAKTTLILSLIGASPTAWAEEHDHDHEHFPEGTLLALEGQDAVSKADCFLFVTDLGFTGPEQTPAQFFAKVQTSYSHDRDAAQEITVQLHATRPDVLVGTGANGQDQIAIFLDPHTLDLRTAKSFNLKWLHGTHFHTNKCMGLTPHED